MEKKLENIWGKFGEKLEKGWKIVRKKMKKSWKKVEKNVGEKLVSGKSGLKVRCVTDSGRTEM